MDVGEGEGVGERHKVRVLELVTPRRDIELHPVERPAAEKCFQSRPPSHVARGVLHELSHRFSRDDERPAASIGPVLKRPRSVRLGRPPSSVTIVASTAPEALRSG